MKETKLDYIARKRVDNYRVRAFWLIYIGVGIIVIFFIMMALSGMLWGKSLDLDAATMLGTFIGGMVGTIWALAGVLLFYAALIYQREEFRVSRESRDDLKNAYDDQKIAYQQQIENGKLMKFQASFYELLKLFLSKRDDVTNSVRINTRTGKNVHDFDDVTKELQEYAIECNVKFEQPEQHLLFYTVPEQKEFNHKFIEFIEFFILICTEINRFEDKIAASGYERILLNLLTFHQISSIIFYAVTEIDNSGRLRNIIMKSENWESRCMVMLNQNPDISLFWTRFQSTNREKYT